jgi:hypothetical protein
MGFCLSSYRSNARRSPRGSIRWRTLQSILAGFLDASPPGTAAPPTTAVGRFWCLVRTDRLVKICELTRRAFVWCQGAQQVPRLSPNFLPGLVASANFMRLSLKKAAYVAVDESSVVGNPEYARDDKWRVVTFIRGCRIGWTEKQQQVPRLSQDFLSGLVALVDFMRLSLKKAAYGRTTARLT